MKTEENPSELQLFELIKAGFSQVPFIQLLGIEIAELKKDRARLTLPWKPELERSTGSAHGGVIATLLDVAGAAAVASNLETTSGKTFSTISLLINYIDSSGGEDLTAEASVIRRTKTLAFIEARVLTPSGRLLATGSMVYKI